MFGNLKKFRLFSAFGFPVEADVGALILVALILIIFSPQGPAGMLVGIGIVGIAFLSIYAHELGHAFAIRRLGYGGSVIIFSGLGGLTQWRGRPSHGDSIKISLAGPAVSLLIGALAAIPLWGFGIPGPETPLLRFTLQAVVFLNLIWGFFNLLPIYPMDGGKVARSLLSMRMPSARAVRLSLKLSGVVGLALLLTSAALSYFFVAVLIGFLLLQNWNEWQQTTRA